MVGGGGGIGAKWSLHAKYDIMIQKKTFGDIEHTFSFVHRVRVLLKFISSLLAVQSQQLTATISISGLGKLNIHLVFLGGGVGGRVSLNSVRQDILTHLINSKMASSHGKSAEASFVLLVPRVHFAKFHKVSLILQLLYEAYFCWHTKMQLDRMRVTRASPVTLTQTSLWLCYNENVNS